MHRAQMLDTVAVLTYGGHKDRKTSWERLCFQGHNASVPHSRDDPTCLTHGREDTLVLLFAQ